MSRIIMPSGKNELVKEAGSDDLRDKLYLVAKKALAQNAVAKKAQVFPKDEDKKNEDVTETEEVADVVVEPSEADTNTDDVVDIDVDKAGNIKDICPKKAIEKAKDALESVEIALDEAKIALEEDGECEDKNDEEATDVSFEVEDEENADEKDDKIIVRSKDKEECEDEEECEDGKKLKESCASVDGFVKISMTSKKTQKEVYNYFKSLGLPEEYCKLMVTNYEKK